MRWRRRWVNSMRRQHAGHRPSFREWRERRWVAPLTPPQETGTVGPTETSGSGSPQGARSS